MADSQVFDDVHLEPVVAIDEGRVLPEMARPCALFRHDHDRGAAPEASNRKTDGLVREADPVRGADFLGDTAKLDMLSVIFIG